MAADNSSAMTKLTDITACCICLKTFTDPRMLPCIHTFCLQCLKDMADKSDKKPGEALPCPVCRKEFTIPNHGIEVVQKNVFMTSLIEVTNALNQSKMKALLCDICNENNKITATEINEATVRCLVCMENLCEGCLQLHNTFKLMKNHDILNIGNYAETKETVKNFKQMNCDIHRGKAVDYYCAECKKVVCVSCFVESHRTHDCKDVTTVEEEFRKIINSSAQVISSLAEELLAKKNKSEGKEEFLKKMTKREQEILQRSDELKEMIEEHTKSLLSSLDEIKNRHLKEIQTEEDELDRRLTILESFSRYCDELSSKGSASNVCRSKDELLRRADELEEDHETYIMRPRVSYDATFQATDLDNLFKTRSANIVGNVKENIEVLEDLIVAIGGAEEDVYSYKINLHDQRETVSTIENAPISVKRYHAADVYNNTLFITGVELDEIWKFNFASGWKKCGSLVEGRIFHCAVFLRETCYICGGSSYKIDVDGNKYMVIDSIESYNALTERSTIVGQLRYGSEDASCVAYKDSIFVFGGSDKDKKDLDCVQVYSPIERICTLLSTPMPRPETFMRALLWGSYAILLNKSTCFIFDIEKKTWQERNQFKTDVIRFQNVLVNERIFVMEGEVKEDDAQDASQHKWRPTDDIKCMRASSILNNEATKWKTRHHLPRALKGVGLFTSAKLSLVK